MPKRKPVYNDRRKKNPDRRVKQVEASLMAVNPATGERTVGVYLRKTVKGFDLQADSRIGKERRTGLSDRRVGLVDRRRIDRRKNFFKLPEEIILVERTGAILSKKEPLIRVPISRERLQTYKIKGERAEFSAISFLDFISSKRHQKWNASLYARDPPMGENAYRLIAQSIPKELESGKLPKKEFEGIIKEAKSDPGKYIVITINFRIANRRQNQGRRVTDKK